MTADLRSENARLPNAEPCVVLLLSHSAHPAAIVRVVQQCGARVRHCEAIEDAVRACRGAMCAIAIVSAERLGSNASPALETMGALKAAGFSVICCQEHASALPLGQQCRAFLAGCSHLLDCAHADFEAELREVLQRRLREDGQRAGEERELHAAMVAQGIVGESRAMLGVFRLAARVAKLSHFPVLITGESGTGKELMANAIHQLDPLRNGAPFVAVNCAAVAHELAESELFGHRRGAFTGADRERKGLFRSADGGVLFLDEIAELEERVQAKLLRALQEQRVLGLGEDIETPVNVRVVAATNANLQARVREGRFRADLLNRLSALVIHLPPLRERREDVPPLAEHFIAKCRELRGGRAVRASAEFMAALSQLEFFGNVRQLENLIRWILLNKSDDAVLSLRDLPPPAWEQLAGASALAASQVHDSGADSWNRSIAVSESSKSDAATALLAVLHANRWSMAQSLAACERLFLNAALEHEHGNQSRAARLLGITARSVYNKLRKHSLQPPMPGAGIGTSRHTME